VLLLDSDNEIDSRYLSALENVSPWSPTVLYLPTFAAPVHDYRAYDDQTYDAFSIRQMIDKPRFLTALNTGNFFFNRESFLKIFDATSQPLAADSLYMVYRWLSNGGSIRFVSGAHYHHTHNSRDGNYNRYAERSATKFDRIIRAMRDGKWGEYVID
jgi:hypothetical protein